jgi:4-hydroxy-3-methylbut-2-enyl diphosphate reductase
VEDKPEKVIVCDPRGFCAGVEMAIKALGWMVEIFDPPVYCYHEIVHNKLVVETFERAGVVFVDDPAAVPPGAPVMLSAHGTAPDVAATASSQGRIVVDAVCPLVTKVHHEARTRAAKGYGIIYVGHAGHDEAVGTVAEAPEAIRLVEKTADLDRLDFGTRPVALLAQTTLAHSEWQDVLEEAQRRYPDVWTAGRSDLCFATTNRQAAVRQLAPQVDMLLVIGSDNSSNTQALVRTGQAAGCERSVRIDGPEDISADLLAGARVVGVTAGASAPESVVEAVVARIGAPAKETLRVTDEDEYFPLPRELREMLRDRGIDPADKSKTAADVLAALHGCDPLTR